MPSSPEGTFGTFLFLKNGLVVHTSHVCALKSYGPKYESVIMFLGAACGSPYIVFISTSGMLRLSDIYIYIYIYI